MAISSSFRNFAFKNYQNKFPLKKNYRRDHIDHRRDYQYRSYILWHLLFNVQLEMISRLNLSGIPVSLQAYPFFLKNEIIFLRIFVSMMFR